MSSGVCLLRIWHKLNVEDVECLVVYCSRSKRRMMELGMSAYEVMCAGIEKPICFGTSWDGVHNFPCVEGVP